MDVAENGEWMRGIREQGIEVYPVQQDYTFYVDAKENSHAKRREFVLKHPEIVSGTRTHSHTGKLSAYRISFAYLLSDASHPFWKIWQDVHLEWILLT